MADQHKEVNLINFVLVLVLVLVLVCVCVCVCVCVRERERERRKEATQDSCLGSSALAMPAASVPW